MIPFLVFTTAHAQNTETGSAFNNKPARDRIAIILEEKTGKAAKQTTINPTTEIKDEKAIASFKKPPGEYPHFCIRRLVIDRAQFYRDQYRHGQLSQEQYLKNVRFWKIDTTMLSQEPNTRNTVFFFVALDGNGKKHVVVDENNNHDFTDDREIIVDTVDCHKPAENDTRVKPAYKATVAYYDGKKLREKKMPFALNPYESHFDRGDYANRTEQLLDISVEVSIGWQGVLALDGVSQHVYGFGMGNSLIPFAGGKIGLRLEADSATNYYYHPGETIQLGTGIYKWRTAPLSDGPYNDMMMIIMDKVADSKPYSALAGDQAPDFRGTDLLSSKAVSLSQYKGRYVLIDFWGTWCGPCKDMIPDLVKKYGQYKGKKVEFISIAWDYKKQDKALREMIKGFGMEWINIHQDRETHLTDSSLSRIFKVQVFPTLFIIDDKGQIVFRGAGTDHLEKATAFLDEWVAKQ